MFADVLKKIHHYKEIILGDKDYYELIHGVGLSAIFMIGGMGISYVVSILSARWFGAEGMGLMAMINTIIVFAGAIAGLGIQGSVVRYINQRKAQGVAGRIRTLHGYIIRTVLPFSLLIAIVLYLLRGWLANTVFGEPQLEQLIMYLALAFPFIVLGKIGLEMIKGYKDLISYHSINKIAKVLIRLGVIATVRYSSYSLLGPAIGLIVGAASGFVMMLPSLWKFYKKLPSKEIISNNDILKTSLPMMVTSIGAIIINQTDILMLGIYSNTSDVGVYQVAFRMAKLIPFGLMLVNMIIGQKIAQLYFSQNKDKLQSTLRIGVWISTSIGLIAGILFFVFAKQRMAIFGNEFISGALLLQILSVGQLISTLSGPCGLYMNMTGKQKMLQWIVGSTAIINILLNLYMIPIYGAVGAAIASAIAYSINNLSKIVIIYKLDKIKVFTH